VVILDFNTYLVRRLTAAENGKHGGGLTKPPNTDTAFVRIISGKPWAGFSEPDSFAEDVGGSLPFVETRSRAEFDYASVMINEEQLLLTNVSLNSK
jgi:hypothetical protein